MCAALYCEPKWRDFGSVWFGQRGFGGLLQDFSSYDANGRTKWIPQYNLAAFWKRDIPPHSVGLVEPLILPRLRKSKFSRLPGHFSDEIPPYELDNRNLLTAKYFAPSEDSLHGFIRIWTVNERSRRHFLEQFDVQLNKKSILKSHNVTTYVGEDGENGWKIDKAALELRCSPWSDLVPTGSDKDAAIWIRTSNSLKLKRSESSEMETIFNSSVRDFDESLLTFGELFIVDYGGMVWLRDLATQSAQRIKCVENNEIFELVSHCDHPRKIALATQHQMQILDVRSPDSQNVVDLFKTNAFETKLSNDPKYIQSTAPPQPKIRHLRSVPNSSNHYIVMTDYALHLVDDRFPNNSVLTVHHGVPAGGHKMIVSDRTTDEIGGGEVTSVFVLDQLHTNVSICKLYEHKSKLWSAVSLLQSFGHTVDFNSVVRRGKHLDAHKVIDEPTRSISLVEGIIDKKGRDVSILLRQTDDGAIWWQRMMNAEIVEEKRVNYDRRSCNRVEKWLEERDEKDLIDPEFAAEFDEKLRVNPKTKRLLLEVDGDIEKKLVRKCWKTAETERRKAGGLYFDDSDVQEKMHPEISKTKKHILSNIVINTWRKTELLTKKKNDDEDEDGKVCGFRGSHDCEGSEYDSANLAQTYSALLCLAILGDDLSRVDRKAILATIRKSQRENGCFWSQDEDSESDMRFVYCAASICHILGDDEAIDWTKLRSFVRNSLNIDGGIGQGPSDESHGGSTFCAIASLALSNRLWTEEVLTRNELKRLTRWALLKQDMGFHGRAHKPDDSCYAFWIGSTLNILNAYNLISATHLREFLMIAQHSHIGGFCKYPERGGYSDLLHTYFSIAALAVMREPTINPIHSAMNVSMRAYEHIAKLNLGRK